MNARARGLAKGAVLLGMIGGFALIPGVATAGNDGVTLAHVDGAWQVTLDSTQAWEVKLIDPAPQEIACGQNVRPCDATVYRFASTAECVTVQVDWRNNVHNSTDPRACRDTTTPTEEPTWTPEPTTPPAPTPDPSPSTPSETPSEPSTPPETTTPPPSNPSSEPQPTETTPEQPSAEPSPTETSQPGPSATPDPTEPTTPPAPIQCEAGYAPGWLDENGNPTGCVWNGTTTNPEPEETPWTPTVTPSSQPSNAPSNGPNEKPGTPTSVTGAKTTAPSVTDGSTPSQPSTVPASTSLAATGSNTTGWVLAAGLTLLLGAYLYLTNHRRKP